jgi:hypothetical protein
MVILAPAQLAEVKLHIHVVDQNLFITKSDNHVSVQNLIIKKCPFFFHYLKAGMTITAGRGNSS